MAKYKKHQERAKTRPHHAILSDLIAAGVCQRLYLHGLLIYGPSPPGRPCHVDHKDHDSLNNRRANLRGADNSTNGANRHGWGVSGYKGVDTFRSGFRARIRKHKKEYHLGMFKDPVEAAKAYDAAAREFHGEFAKLNFPGDAV